MLIFATEQKPPRNDKPHICADGRTIRFFDPLRREFKEGFAEEGHHFGVAEVILNYMQGRQDIANRLEKGEFDGQS